MKSKIQEKEAGTNFVLSSQSQNIIGQFMKTYLHRPIKILQFLTPARIQKCSKYLQNILAFLTIRRLQADSRI